MKYAIVTVIFSIGFLNLFAQEESGIEEEILPRYLTESELRQISEGNIPERPVSRGIQTPPPFDNIRNMAEWEEIQALTIAWTAYPAISKQIVRAAKEECEVIILSENPSSTQNYLMVGNAGGPALDNMDNVTIIDSEFDSIWMRDYAANAVYGNEVDDLFLVDWIYNRPARVNDDASPQYIADYLGLDLYCLDQNPTDLVNTGGNYMSDGFGHAFASDLILDENEPMNISGVSTKSLEEIETIMDEWLGIDNYTLMPILPYDLIHHIDMHMKLIDEETILVGNFGDESDGPQIMANIEYVMSNTTTKWGTPWKIRWVPMIPSVAGNWPDGDFSEPYYRTFTNSIFINNTILFPSYREEFDSIAQRVYEELLPGYTIVAIDCDNSPSDIIASAGALHCITHSIGVEDPLLISHNPLEDTDDSTNDYLVEAYMNHRSGVTNAQLFWRIEGAEEYSQIALSSVGGNNWEGYIPAQLGGTTVEYYVKGESNSGKVMNRPMPAPEAFWNFKVVDELVNIPANEPVAFAKVYPNPANGITVIPVVFSSSSSGRVELIDAQGKTVSEVYLGEFSVGEKKYFFDASVYSPGIYTVSVIHEHGTLSQKIVIE